MRLLILLITIVFVLWLSAAEGNVPGRATDTNSLDLGLKSIKSGVNVDISGYTVEVNALQSTKGIRVGDTSTTDAGTLRWDGSNFQGYTGSEWINLDHEPVLYLQTVEVWTSDGSGTYDLANTPDGQVIVIYENSIWQFPYVNYTVSGNTVTIIGGTTLGDNFLFSYIYH